MASTVHGAEARFGHTDGGGRPAYVTGIDGLRALAVLAVIAFHVDPAIFPGGYIGVDIFFVVSGFVVTRSLQGRTFASFRELLVYFYRRRLARVLPALAAMLLVVSAAVSFLPAGAVSGTSGGFALSALAGISNLVLAFDRGTYESGYLNPFAHTWSLGVEEQYYLLFPILAWAALGSTGRERSLGWAPVAALCVGSFGICALLARTYWPYALFLMPARFWELGVGMLLALTLARWAPFVGRNRAFALACVALGSAAIGIGLCIPITPTFPFPGAILPVAGAAALVAHVAARPSSSVSRLLSTPPARWAGRISYSLYLWHWPVIALFRAVGLDRAPHMLAAVALSFGLAYVSYRFVEQPFRRPRTTALS